MIAAPALNPLMNSSTSPASRLAPRGLRAATIDFVGTLETAQELDAAAQDRARTAANQLVATALVQPILAQMRSSPFKSELFHGGRGEEVFGQQLDTVLAERIASSPTLGLGSAVAERLTGGLGRGQAVNVHG